MTIMDMSKLAFLMITAAAGVMSVLINFSKADKDTIKQLKIVMDKVGRLFFSGLL